MRVCWSNRDQSLRHRDRGHRIGRALGLGMPGGSTGRHEVRILDMRIEPALEETLAEFRPHVVGSGGYTWAYPP